jgi:hypothetical protein
MGQFATSAPENELWVAQFTKLADAVVAKGGRTSR